MRELPKFVIERLKISTPSALHPDADVLTAFAERALPNSERAVVTEHLARCGDCRNIIALALPATEALEPAGVIVGFRSRWRWPVLRGAAVVAGVIAVAAVGIYEYQHRTPANVIVARSAERNQASPSPNETAAPRPEPASPSADLRLDAAAPSRSAVVASKPLSGAGDAPGWRAKSTRVDAGSAGPAAGPAGAIVAGTAPVPSTKMAMTEPPRDLAFAAPQPPPAKTMKQIPAPSPAHPDAVPASSEVVEVQGQSELVTGEAQPSTLYARNEVQTRVESTDKVRRAKPPASASGAPALASPMAARNLGDLQELHQAQLHQAPMPRWTISAAGSLQRSLDGGRSWQDVIVNAKPGAYGGSTQGAIENRAAKAAATDGARDKDKNDGAERKEKSARPETAAAPLFRVVATIGNEVWAGASGGLLYHSADAGTLWTSITPSAQGVVLTGDIIRIEFSDPLHGKITTSTFEVWTTADSGQSWRKQ